MIVSITLKVALGLLLLVLAYAVLIAITDRTKKLVKCKSIKTNSKSSFIFRISYYLKKGSIKLHLILSDDKDKPHTHPWDFKSFLIIPYKEILYANWNIGDYIRTRKIKHRVFTTVVREANQRHKTILYRIFGIPIPALTIGYYGEKKQLCSFCQTLGYCKENPPKEKHTTEERQRVDKMVDIFDPFNGYERIV